MFGAEKKDKIIELCDSIKNKDNTFNYKILTSKDKGKYLLKIFSHKQTKDQAHKRGMYFVKKMNLGEFYSVK